LGEFSPIGRLVLGWGLKITEAAQIFGMLFSTVLILASKMVGLLLATFSKTHLVTLLCMYDCCE
jgi:hypothetical protein